jgi:hypothetical protein
MASYKTVTDKIIVLQRSKSISMGDVELLFRETGYKEGVAPQRGLFF